MKSIMEEASSISKAVDQAWNRAGKPQEFKIKIFEEPVRNMLGFTTKPAKIAFFYEEIVEQAKKTYQQRPAEHSQQVKRPAPQQPHNQPVERQQERPRPQQIQTPHQAPRQPQPQSPHRPAQQRPMAIWEDDLVGLVSTWIKSTLPLMGFPHASFTTVINHNVLHVTFANPFTQDEGKERMLLSSFAHLVMLAVRHQAKRHIGNLKIVLKSK